MKKIKEVIPLDWELRITYVYREANKCVNVLANMNCESGT